MNIYTPENKNYCQQPLAAMACMCQFGVWLSRKTFILVRKNRFAFTATVGQRRNVSSNLTRTSCIIMTTKKDKIPSKSEEDESVKSSDFADKQWNFLFAQFEKESDRAAVILISSVLDENLTTLLKSYFVAIIK